MLVSFRMKNALWGAVLIVVALVGLPAAAQAPTPREVLLRSLQQEGQFDYQGTQSTIVKVGAKEHRTDQIVKFKRPNRLRIEYLAPPRLKGDVVLDDGERTRRFVRRLGIVEEGPAIARAFDPKRRRQIARAVRTGQLQLTLAGEDAVAGRRAWVLELTPTDPSRPRRKLWLDEEFGLPLRVVQTGPADRVSDTFFRQITFNQALPESEFADLPAPPGTPSVPRPRGRLVGIGEAERIARENWGRLYRPRKLPPGFTLRAVQVLELQGQPIVHLRYGDGLRGISLFQSAGPAPREPLPILEPIAGRPRPNVLPLTRGRAALLVVGPFRPERLQKFADSLE
jgi:outer membrane lipoprotein-sorting protein